MAEVQILKDNNNTGQSVFTLLLSGKRDGGIFCCRAGLKGSFSPRLLDFQTSYLTCQFFKCKKYFFPIKPFVTETSKYPLVLRGSMKRAYLWCNLKWQILDLNFLTQLNMSSVRLPPFWQGTWVIHRYLITLVLYRIRVQEVSEVHTYFNRVLQPIIQIREKTIMCLFIRILEKPRCV